MLTGSIVSAMEESQMDSPRKGWAKAFALMHERGEDALLIDDGLDLDKWPELLYFQD